ncbi:MAG TPA: adenylosuccinate synthetase, partial [Candidatus Methanomethylia archaeon]|nr:adenylosuccinate synthetase [Candidatus Methanomethylicia archaeon]
MSLAVLVGGFFGDEGKGKIAAYLSLKDDMSIGVRTGAINAGHTVVFNGSKYKLRIIPSAFVNRSSRLLIAAGALFSLDVLKKELEATQAYG